MGNKSVSAKDGYRADYQRVTKKCFFQPVLLNCVQNNGKIDSGLSMAAFKISLLEMLRVVYD